MGKFWRALDLKTFIHFMAILNTLRSFANFVFIWYIFSGFGIMYQEKSGNPGASTCHRCLSPLLKFIYFETDSVLLNSTKNHAIETNCTLGMPVVWFPGTLPRLFRTEQVDLGFAPAYRRGLARSWPGDQCYNHNFSFWHF
jgi:hypothetical protein